MSTAISVRIGEQLVEVPSMRLSWGADHPELCALIDWYKDRHVLGEAGVSAGDELGKLAELVRGICGVAGFKGELDCDLGDVARLYAALRGVETPDPTAPPPG